ncbi:MAG TPA: hypothetical protein VKE24_12195, partial [Candidatus Acidoferrales bacterium]|nr:hypothetical protein [Candidatus Acidoferrales bacterium]
PAKSSASAARLINALPPIRNSRLLTLHMSPPVFSFGGLNAFALENDGLESISGRIIRWVARKSRLAGKDDWTV